MMGKAIGTIGGGLIGGPAGAVVGASVASGVQDKANDKDEKLESVESFMDDDIGPAGGPGLLGTHGYRDGRPWIHDFDLDRKIWDEPKVRQSLGYTFDKESRTWFKNDKANASAADIAKYNASAKTEGFGQLAGAVALRGLKAVGKHAGPEIIKAGAGLAATAGLGYLANKMKKKRTPEESDDMKRESFQGRVEAQINELNLGKSARHGVAGAAIGAASGLAVNGVSKLVGSKRRVSVGRVARAGGAIGAAHGLLSSVDPTGAPRLVEGMSTRHHFQSTADILRSHADSMDSATHRSLVDHFSDQYMAENPRFQPEKFKKAAGYKDKEK